MIIQFTCQYCNHIWTLNTLYNNPNSKPYCALCGDSNVTAKDLDKTKIDTYAGSPPFAEKDKKKDEDLNWRLD